MFKLWDHDSSFLRLLLNPAIYVIYNDDDDDFGVEGEELFKTSTVKDVGDEDFNRITDVEPKYNPNEVPLQVATLTNYKIQLETINTEVKNAYTPYSNAMIARNKKLYDPEKGLVNRAQLVKNYVKSIFGASSPEYKQINKLRFKEIV